MQEFADSRWLLAGFNRLCSLGIGGIPAVVPTLSGTSWIYGLNTIVLDNDDPFPEGFTVVDIWA
ncbi:proline racemase family protein [Mesorhizobium qingshengii]|uniref:proline racemase family protein n=1 Tax=Mesorhizobium qingshengii TaxID=1165689 RepID=UPI001FCE08A1|nr:proline racemase family protein [Mesorhizobium qingshengii]